MLAEFEEAKKLSGVEDVSIFIRSDAPYKFVYRPKKRMVEIGSKVLEAKMSYTTWLYSFLHEMKHAKQYSRNRIISRIQKHLLGWKYELDANIFAYRTLMQVHGSVEARNITRKAFEEMYENNINYSGIGVEKEVAQKRINRTMQLLQMYCDS